MRRGGHMARITANGGDGAAVRCQPEFLGEACIGGHGILGSRALEVGQRVTGPVIGRAHAAAGQAAQVHALVGAGMHLTGLVAHAQCIHLVGQVRELAHVHAEVARGAQDVRCRKRHLP